VTLVSISAVVEAAAETTRDKCYIHPQNFRRQCFKDFGAWCNPTDGTYWLEATHSIKAEPRIEACVERKRAEARGSSQATRLGAGDKTAPRAKRREAKRTTAPQGPQPSNAGTPPASGDEPRKAGTSPGNAQ
jgi:hypothetical protein